MNTCVYLNKKGEFLVKSDGPSHGNAPRYHFVTDINQATLFHVNRPPKNLPKGLLAIIAEEHRTVTFIIPEEE